MSSMGSGSKVNAKVSSQHVTVDDNDDDFFDWALNGATSLAVKSKETAMSVVANVEKSGIVDTLKGTTNSGWSFLSSTFSTVTEAASSYLQPVLEQESEEFPKFSSLRTTKPSDSKFSSMSSNQYFRGDDESSKHPEKSDNIENKTKEPRLKLVSLSSNQYFDDSNEKPKVNTGKSANVESATSKLKLVSLSSNQYFEFSIS